MLGFYAAYAVVYAYTQARTTNLQWNHTYGPGLRFESTLGARKLAAIYLGNIVAAALTAWDTQVPVMSCIIRVGRSGSMARSSGRRGWSH
jgi:hypothetical protein